MRPKPWMTVLAVVVAAVLLVAVLVPLLLDAERFRPAVEARLAEALNRPVHIGKLGFSWMAGGVAAREIAIGEDPAFGQRPFLTARTLDVKVELAPLLLHRELHIQSVKVREPEVVLRQDGQGRWNFATLGAAKKAGKAEATAAPATSPSLNKLAITGARVVIEGRGSAQTYSDVNLETGKLAPRGNSRFTLAAKTPGGGKFKAEGTLGPLGGPTGDLLPSTPLQADITLDNLDLAGSGYFGRSGGVGGTAALKAKLKYDGCLAHLEGTSQIERLRLAKDATAMRRPVDAGFAVVYNPMCITSRMAISSGELSRGELRIGKSVARLAGTFGTSGAATRLTMAMTTPSLAMTDLQELLPALGVALPGGASLEGGTANAQLNVSGEPGQLVISGPVRLAEVTIGGFDLGSKLKSVGRLAGINTGAATRVESLATNLRMTPEGTRLDNLTAVIAGVGAVTGAGTLGTNHTLDFHLLAKLASGGGVLGGILQSANIGQLSTVPFRVEGTTTDPRFVPDVNAILTPQQQQQQGQAQPAPTPLGGILQELFRKKR